MLKFLAMRWGGIEVAELMGEDSASCEAITGEWVLLLLAGGFREG